MRDCTHKATTGLSSVPYLLSHN
uniref:Uncharacterized protein n=1 Tax=Arundo donax TaxID=35708 RepID=A0A0A8ZVC2_ARUDO